MTPEEKFFARLADILKNGENGLYTVQFILMDGGVQMLTTPDRAKIEWLLPKSGNDAIISPQSNQP